MTPLSKKICYISVSYILTGRRWVLKLSEYSSNLLEAFCRRNFMEIWTPFLKGLRLIASFTQFAIELRLISIIRLIATLCETGPWSACQCVILPLRLLCQTNFGKNSASLSHIRRRYKVEILVLICLSFLFFVSLFVSASTARNNRFLLFFGTLEYLNKYTYMYKDVVYTSVGILCIV